MSATPWASIDSAAEQVLLVLEVDTDSFEDFPCGLRDLGADPIARQHNDL